MHFAVSNERADERVCLQFDESFDLLLASVGPQKVTDAVRLDESPVFVVLIERTCPLRGRAS